MLDEGHPAPEARKRLAHLQAHRAAAYDHHAGRHLARRRRLAVGPHGHALQAFYGRHVRHRTGRDDHVLGLQGLAVHLDLARAGDPAFALEDRGALLLVALHLPRVVEVADHLVAVVEDFLDLQGGGARPEGPPRLVPGLGRSDQGLRGDARPVGALAPDELPLDHRDPLPAGDEAARGHLPAGAHAEYHRVVSFGHPLTPIRCSRTRWCSGARSRPGANRAGCAAPRSARPTRSRSRSRCRAGSARGRRAR